LLISKALGGLITRREQALALVKELVANNLIQTNWLSLEKRKPDSYELKFKGDCDHSLLSLFLQNHRLAIKANHEKGFCIIFKP
jgi:hypothetical protein